MKRAIGKRTTLWFTKDRYNFELWEGADPPQLDALGVWEEGADTVWVAHVCDTQIKKLGLGRMGTTRAYRVTLEVVEIESVKL